MSKKTMNNYDQILEMIDDNIIDAEKLLDIFVNWHGLETLTDDFMEFIDNELE